MQIARRLLGKILIDLRNTREEAINVAELKSNDTQLTKSGKKEDSNIRSSNDTQHTKSGKKEDTNTRSKTHSKNEDTRRSSATDISIDHEDDDEKETEYRLDPKCVFFYYYCHPFDFLSIDYAFHLQAKFFSYLASNNMIRWNLLSGMLM